MKVYVDWHNESIITESEYQGILANEAHDLLQDLDYLNEELDNMGYTSSACFTMGDTEREQVWDLLAERAIECAKNSNFYEEVEIEGE